MKKIEIIGENRFDICTKTRTACRAVIIKDGKMLLSYCSKGDAYMLPGGGIEKGESDAECCVREVAEETGVIVTPSECLLEIDEYYEEWKFVNKYFVCTVSGTAERHLTETEKSMGLEPRWIPKTDAKNIFGSFRDYEGKDEMKRGMYLREHTALCELEGNY